LLGNSAENVLTAREAGAFRVERRTHEESSAQQGLDISATVQDAQDQDVLVVHAVEDDVIAYGEAVQTGVGLRAHRRFIVRRGSLRRRAMLDRVA
jgi:hypothetical protein